jgi:hypothetical protein
VISAEADKTRKHGVRSSGYPRDLFPEANQITTSGIDLRSKCAESFL